jgi:predicted KAP-like P-loop ATPase
LLRLSEEKRSDGTTRVSGLLERLADYTEDGIPEGNISTILDVFFDVGDRLLKEEDEGRGLLSFGNDARIGRIIFKLLRRIDEPERFVDLSRAFRAGRSIGIMEDTVVTLGQQHGKWTSDKPNTEEERLLSAEHLVELEAITLEKIRAAARNQELLASKHLPSILYRWREWGGEAEMKSWVQQAVSSDEGMIEFVERFLHRTYSQTLGDVATRTVYRLDPKNVEPFIEPSLLVERIEKVLGKKDLSDNQRKALTEYVKEFKIRAQGKNPDAVLRS